MPKVFPLQGRFVVGVPHVTTEVDTKKAAQDLVATGAFTDNPNDPNRIPADEAAPPKPAEEPAPPEPEEQ